MTISICILIGIVSLAMALHFRINPVEGSVVDKRIVDTPVDLFLGIAAIPAWCFGVFMSPDDGSWCFFFMYIGQIILFGIIGLIIDAIVRSIERYIPQRMDSPNGLQP